MIDSCIAILNNGSEDMMVVTTSPVSPPRINGDIRLKSFFILFNGHYFDKRLYKTAIIPTETADMSIIWNTRISWLISAKVMM